MGRPTIRLLVAIGLWLIASHPASACTCSSSGPVPCPGLERPFAGGLSFVGTVIDVENSPGEDDDDQSGIARYHFRVDEKLSDFEGTEIDVYSGRGGADCSFHFKKGKQYVVFPYRSEDDRLFATVCSRTGPIEDATALLPQLRARRDGSRAANLYGILRRTSQPYPAVEVEGYERPLPRVEIQLKSKDHLFSTRTDEQGRYAFYDVPAGVYHFAADLPPALELAQTILSDPLPPLELPERACYEHDLTALPTGRIRGRVLSPNGTPLASASVDLFLADRYDDAKPRWYSWWESQGEEGYFEFNHVAPGSYVLVFNNWNRLDPRSPYPRTFYRSGPDVRSATPIRLEDGQQILDADIQLTGGRATTEKSVRVKWIGGDPPSDVYVTAIGNEGAPIMGKRVAPGLFRLTLIRDVSYSIYAQQDCGLRWEGNLGRPIGRVETEHIQVDPSDQTIREITLTYAGAGCPADAKPYRPNSR